MRRRQRLLSLLLWLCVVVLSILTANINYLNAATNTPTLNTATLMQISAETASRLGVFAVIPDTRLYAPYWSSDSKLLIAARYDEVLLYDVPYFDTPSSRIQQLRPYSFTIDPQNRFVAWVTYQDGVVHVLGVATRKETYSLDARASTIQISPDGSLLEVDNRDTGKIEFYELTTGKKLFTIEEDSNRTIFSPDSSLFATTSAYTFSVEVWTIKGKVIQKLRTITSTITREDGQPTNPTNILFTADSKLLVVNYIDSNVVFWEPFTGIAQQTFSMSSDIEPYTTDLVFSPDNKLMASFGFGRADLWNIETGEVISTFPDIDPDRHGGMFNNTGDLFLYSDYNDHSSDVGARLRIWDVVNQRQVLILDYEQAPRLSPDNRYLASLGENGITIWTVH